MRESYRRLLLIVKALGLLFLLNLLLGLFYWLPARSVVAPFFAVPETLLFGVVALLLSRLPERRRTIGLLLPLIIASLLVLFGIGESFYQFIYREHFVPWRDLTFLPGLLNMVLSTERFDDPVLLSIVVALPVALTVSLLYLLFSRLIGLLSQQAVGRAAVPILFMGLLALPAIVSGVWGSPLAVRAAVQVRRPATPDYEAPVETLPESDPLPLLSGGDLRLFVIESYGHTLFTRRDHNALIMPVYRELEADLHEGEFSVVSHFMRSPAFGGRSWLADGTILSGVWLGDQAAYDGVKRTNARTLIDVMNQAGYESVLAAPGMTYFDEGYREFYRFDRFFIQENFHYEGPYYTFGWVPDQYLLHFMERQVADVTGPLFSAYIMVSSHVPFRVVPPYVEEWEELGDGEIYHSLERQVFNNNWLSGGEYPEGYTASIAYSLRSVVDYILRHLDEDDVAVIIGDHQPRIPISERSSTYSVPLHILSRRDRAVEPFLSRGFVDGLIPRQELPHPRMDTLYPTLYEVFRGVPAVAEILAP